MFLLCIDTYTVRNPFVNGIILSGFWPFTDCKRKKQNSFTYFRLEFIPAQGLLVNDFSFNPVYGYLQTMLSCT